MIRPRGALGSRRALNCALSVLAISCLLGTRVGLAMLSGYSAPVLSGQYQPAPRGHPFVFTTRDQLAKVLTTGTPATQQAIALLEQGVREYVAQPNKYTTPYSGCVLEEYLKDLTLEARGESATAVAASLATYAYLTSLHLGYGEPTLATQAQALAKTILLNWARQGFRDAGKFRTNYQQFCNPAGVSDAPTQAAIGLQIGRGMPHWVQAQDLLSGLGSLSSAEQSELDGFLGRVFQLLRNAHNRRAQMGMNECDHFSNHVSAQLMGMAAIARLRDKAEEVAAVAGGDQTLLIPWPLQLQQNIYGRDAHPLQCYATTADHRMFVYTNKITAGEIEDRYRAKPHLMFVYTMGSLQELTVTAAILQSSGYKAIQFAGYGGQTLRTSLDYYAYYFEHFLEVNGAIIPRERSDYPSYDQYVGQEISYGDGHTVDGTDNVITPYALAYRLYPNDAAIVGVLKRAMSLPSKTAPFSRIDNLFLDRLADLPALASAGPTKLREP
jgi:hypothetical protein